ncbi:hypothetical protein BGX26_002202 [Mortierella sp. AD094]|nr:hypothetical protein BGX26_002202 [Mortierella sp. AD094]
MGVFTVISSAFADIIGTVSKGVIVGLQYQSAGNTSGGSGTWNYIYAPSGYTYPPTDMLFYFKDSSGKNTLMKAYIKIGDTPNYLNALVLSTIDPTNLTLSQEISWTLVTVDNHASIELYSRPKLNRHANQMW